MTSVEVPYSIACALPTLGVVDVTNEVARSVAEADVDHGIAFVTAAGDRALVRIQERESGFFTDLEGLLGRLVPLDLPERERLLSFLLGPRTEQIPFSERKLCLGRWQRVLVVGFGERFEGDWTLTLIG
ncbi:MAG: hypothetical protein QOE36_1755 [Gaiellaceae bacterium]|jgi:thiamine phosphate synthase YjbQ (UPF0047 family)|nr:hypothetical protein [Gaiellaceae bacterium]